MTADIIETVHPSLPEARPNLAPWESAIANPPSLASGDHRLSLVGNFRWAMAGNILYALCQWGMLSVLARLGTPEAVGQFALGLSIAAPIMALAMLQLRSLQVTDVHKTYSFGDYFGTRIAWTIVGLLAIVVCAIAGSPDRVTLWVVVLVGLMKAIDSASDIVRGLFQQLERMDLASISLIVKGAGSLLALAVVMWASQNIVLASAAAAMMWMVSFVIYDLPYAKRLLMSHSTTGANLGRVNPRFSRKAFWQLTWTALPLGVVMAVITLQTHIPRYVLQSFAGTGFLGYFTAIVSPMMAGMMVTAAMGQSASPKLARYFAEDLNAFIRLLLRLSAISAAVGVAMIAVAFVLGDRILWVLYGVEYTTYHREFIVVAIAWGLQMISSCWGYGLTAAHYFRTQVLLTAASCLATLGAAFVLVPRYGVMGAVLSVLVTSLTTAVGFTAAMLWAVRAQRVGRVFQRSSL